jgi:hypothetical protein
VPDVRIITSASRGGGVEIVLEDDLLLVRPHGYIGRRLLKDGLHQATAFGHAHAGGWWHVTDTSQVRFVNPLNPITLRRIQRLPNVSGYVVIAPSAFVRFGLMLVRWLLKQNVVVRTEPEARAWIAERVRASGFGYG